LNAARATAKRGTNTAIVIGAGIVGAGAAYYLARAGVDVVLLEERFPASGASGASNGGLSYIGKIPEIIRPSHRSLEMYTKLEREIQSDLELDQQRGLIFIAEDDAAMATLEKTHELCRQHGFHSVLLDCAGVAAREPLIDVSKCVGGITGYAGLEGWVNPFLVVDGYMRAARSLGACVMTGVRALQLVSAGGKVAGVVTPGTDLRAEIVIDCGGIHAGRVAGCGLSLPIIPRRGIVLVTEQSPFKARANIMSATYLAAERARDAQGAAFAVGLAIEQTASGNFLVGSSREFAGERLVFPSALPEAVAKNAARYVPSLARLDVIRVFAGLRPYVPDGAPIIGPLEQYPGYYVASGLEGCGVTMGPWVASTVAGMALGRHCPDAAAFVPSRFSSPGSRAETFMRA